MDSGAFSMENAPLPGENRARDERGFCEST
jgi:hypothetical protein